MNNLDTRIKLFIGDLVINNLNQLEQIAILQAALEDKNGETNPTESIVSPE